MGQLIDTSVFIDLERKRWSPAHLLAAAPDEPVALAAVTASELLVGAYRAGSASRRARREAFVEVILRTVPVVSFSIGVARTHARVWSELLAAGTSIGTHDAQIAATALFLGYAVLTANRRDFDRVPGLVVRQPA